MSTDQQRPQDMPPEKPAHRSISIERRAKGNYTATNARGGTITVSNSGDDFSPVELLLTAIAGCSAIDVDFLTARRVEPESFAIDVDAEKVADADGNHLKDIVVTFRVVFPEGEQGDAARAVLPDIVRKSHDRLCTVSRTVMLGADISTVIA
ncbi:MAG: OsmC family protein [Actinomycetota bacterium]|nr:OsmC family protein [Actinomycetota bacterium]